MALLLTSSSRASSLIRIDSIFFPNSLHSQVRPPPPGCGLSSIGATLAKAGSASRRRLRPTRSPNRQEACRHSPHFSPERPRTPEPPPQAPQQPRPALPVSARSRPAPALRALPQQSRRAVPLPARLPPGPPLRAPPPPEPSPPRTPLPAPTTCLA